MARYDNDSVVTPSVLDRLIDREPQESSEAPMSRAQSVRALRASVRRDLEWLLNSRQTPFPAGEDMPELRRSLYNYGFPDFSHFSFGNPDDKLQLRTYLETVISTFEPRLDQIHVVLLEGEGGPASRTIRFQIEGLLLMDPAPEQITFDTVLSLANGEYQIKGERT